MGYIVHMNALAFQRTDERGLAVGEPEIVKKGGDVPEWVPPFTISALVNAGAIFDATPPEEPDRTEPKAPALPSPEQPPGPDGSLPLMDLGGEAPVDASTDRDVNAASSASSGSTAGVKPDGRASKATWENYAVSVGIDRADAESMSKAELITAVEAREGATA